MTETPRDKIRAAIGLETPIFYAEGDIAFARIKDGKVVIIDIKGGTVAILKANTWCSAVASVSLHGDTAEGFAWMEEFHLPSKEG